MMTLAMKPRELYSNYCHKLQDYDPKDKIGIQICSNGCTLINSCTITSNRILNDSHNPKKAIGLKPTALRAIALCETATH